MKVNLAHVGRQALEEEVTAGSGCVLTEQGVGRCLWTSRVAPPPPAPAWTCPARGWGRAADGFLGPLSCICGWESGAVSRGVDRPEATSWEASILSKA